MVLAEIDRPSGQFRGTEENATDTRAAISQYGIELIHRFSVLAKGVLHVRKPAEYPSNVAATWKGNAALVPGLSAIAAGFPVNGRLRVRRPCAEHHHPEFSGQ